MVDAFAGAKGVARAARRRGLKAWAFEIADGPEGDLTKPAVLQRIRRAAKRGQIACMIMGPPCSSFSQARNSSGRLRSPEHPGGLPERFTFSLLDQKRIRDGNATLDAAIYLIDVCHDFGIPYAFENPHTSIMWSDPRLQRSLRRTGAVECVISHCAFGARWRKNITFMLGNVGDSDFYGLSDGSYRCRGRHGHCSFRRGRHVQLGYPGAGKRAKDFAPTVNAAEYPGKLCSVLVKALTSHLDFPRVASGSR